MSACAFIPAALGWNITAGDAGSAPSTQRPPGVAHASWPKSENKSATRTYARAAAW
jgi:hypothetical protein